MKTEIIEIRELVPNKNLWLCNDKEKVITDKVYLGKDASADDWREITTAEKKTLEEEWKIDEQIESDE